MEWMRSLSELRAQEINLRAKKRHILSDLSRKSPQKWEGENNIYNRRPEASSEELNETFPKRMIMTYSFADEKIEND